MRSVSRCISRGPIRTLLMTSPELAQTREQLGLDAHSRVLLVSTEGDTDPQQYLDIVWGGQYPGINK